MEFFDTKIEHYKVHMFSEFMAKFLLDAVIGIKKDN